MNEQTKDEFDRLRDVLTVLYGKLMVKNHDQLIVGIEYLVSMAWEGRLDLAIDSLRKLAIGK
jgi:hypothetical protein